MRERWTACHVVAALVVASLATPRTQAWTVCPWDCAHDDGAVDLLDVLGVLDQWGTTGTCDVDQSGVVEIDDLIELLAYWGPCPAEPACEAPGAGHCYVPNRTAGCESPGCCNRVCASDPTCCDGPWDLSCVKLALVICGGCGDAAAGPCCEANGTPGCDDAGCCQLVCATDAYCCDVEWDALCATAATQHCACAP